MVDSHYKNLRAFHISTSDNDDCNFRFEVYDRKYDIALVQGQLNLSKQTDQKRSTGVRKMSL